MRQIKRSGRSFVVVSVAAMALSLGFACSHNNKAAAQQQPAGGAPPDAVAEAQTPREVTPTRPEQQKNDHDKSDIFSATKAPPESGAFASQPDQGKVTGFDFYRDP